MAMSHRLAFASFFLVFATVVAQAGGDSAAGQTKAAACAACHGADGNSADPAFPSLAGQHASYLLKQLTEYKSGARANAIMSGMTASLSKADMEDIAAFYATQSIKPLASEQDSEIVAQGRILYLAGKLSAGVPACAACHGSDGYGNPGAGYPALIGQHPAYAEGVLKAFRDGTRVNDANGLMRQAAKGLTDEDIRALAAYTASLN